ncbi:MAG: FixH family protein [Betaproteobacteria bacterium]|nr:FixH family protein [Betaproteobacteria bacterium]
MDPDGRAAAVIVAGAITIWIAFATSDGLVAEDYYKQGLAVNQMLKREAVAAEMKLKARVEFPDGFHRVRVSLDGAAPAELRLRLVHATRAGHDLQLRLARTGTHYEAAVAQALARVTGVCRSRIRHGNGVWRGNGLERKQASRLSRSRISNGCIARHRAAEETCARRSGYFGPH